MYYLHVRWPVFISLVCFLLYVFMIYLPDYYLLFNFGGYSEGSFFVLSMAMMLISIASKQGKVFLVLCLLLICKYAPMCHILNERDIDDAVISLFPFWLFMLGFFPERKPLSLYNMGFLLLCLIKLVFFYITFYVMFDLAGFSNSNKFNLLLYVALAICILVFRRKSDYINIVKSTFVLCLVGLYLNDGDIRYSEALYLNLLCLVAYCTYRIWAISYTDELTGVKNRRSLFSDLKSKSGGYSLVVADVDDFKSLNDTYGHDVGDDALRLVASSLQCSVKGAQVYRYGGEEFVIVIPIEMAKHAVSYVEEVKEKLSDKKFVVRKSMHGGKAPVEMTITASFGITEFRTGDTISTLVKRADKAMYLAKSQGKNQVVLG